MKNISGAPLADSRSQLGLATVSGLLWACLNFFQAAFTVLWTLFWIPLALLVRLVTRSTRIPLAMARSIWAPGLLWGAGVRVEVQGLQGLDFSRPYFFVMNHQSQIDIATLFHVLPMNLRFIVKEELRCVPFLGWYISAMGMIFINRKQRLRALASVRSAADVVRSGHSVVAFPEGGRGRSGRIGRFKNGALLPAIEAGAQVVPMAIEGAAEVLPPDGFRVRPGTIRLAIGSPISTEGLAKEDRRIFTKAVHRQVLELHEGLVAQRRREALELAPNHFGALGHPEPSLGED